MDYGIDGVILDMVRWAWQDGRYLKGIYDDENHTLMGYDPPILAAWAAAGKPDLKTVSNSDPEWLEFRAEKGMTQFLRELKPLTTARGVELGVNVFTGRNLARSLVDVETWIDESLIDVVPPYTGGALPWKYYEATEKFVKMAKGRALVAPVMGSMWPDQGRLSLPIISAPLNARAAGVILYEAEAVHEGHYEAVRTLKGINVRR